MLLDCEHFFDGYKANPDYALACAKAAYEEGARWVVLCDTNGGTLPHEIEAIVGAVTPAVPGDHVGIHAHNDTEQAVANSLAAVRAGARQIQGTLNGLGERCGNANLVSLIGNLKLKPDYAERFEIGVADDKLASLTQRLACARRNPQPRAATATRPMWARARSPPRPASTPPRSSRTPRPTSMCGPRRVGNRRKLLVSDQAGRSNVLAELERIGIAVERDDPRVSRLLDVVKEREAVGYAYEAADASFELLARRMLGQVPQYFDVTQFDVNVEQRINATGERVTREPRGGQGHGRRREADLGRRRQRPRQRARPRAAQGPRQVPELHQRASISPTTACVSSMPAPRR